MSNRPLSPHLSIYKPQVTSGVSIIGRLCGIYVYLFVTVAIWAVVYSIYKYANPFIPFFATIMAIKVAHSFVMMVSYLIIAITGFAFSFYLGTLIRHIFWNYGAMLSLKSSSIFGYVIIAFSVFFAVASVAVVAM